MQASLVLLETPRSSSHVRMPAQRLIAVGAIGRHSAVVLRLVVMPRKAEGDI
jgi:hypothetical protein